MDTAEMGARLNRLRLVAGLGQVELAQQANIANGTISKIENGFSVMPRHVAERLGRVLDCSADFLVGSRKVPRATRPWLRAYADAPKKTVDQQVADCTLAFEAIEALALQRIPEQIPTFAADPNDDEEIENYAVDVRIAAGIQEGAVVGNVIRATERLGCVVLPMSHEMGRHMGLSLFVGSTPMLCISKASEPGSGRGVPGDRQRFTGSHELGHICLHSGLGAPESATEANLIEKQAHRFAGAFLLPGDALIEDLQSLGGRVTLRTLVELKERWGVSIKALVMRFQVLRVIDADHARSLHKQISARGWTKVEPGPVGGERAIWFARALARRAQSKDFTSVAAATTGLGGAHFQRWTTWEFEGRSDIAAASVTALPVDRVAPSRRKSATDGGVIIGLPRRN